MGTDGLGIQIREHLDGAKPPTGAKDRGNIAALKEIAQGPGPLLLRSGQVPFAIQNPRGQLDFETRARDSIHAGPKLLIMDRPRRGHNTYFFPFV